MYWTNILMYNVSLLAKNNNISQNEIDDYFYQTWKEISYFYQTDISKVKDYFSDLNCLEAKLALSWMAFDIETVKKTASTYHKFKKVSNKKKILFKEILFTENGIKCVLTDEITSEINEKIKAKKGRIDYEYLFEKQIEDLKDAKASIEYITNNINNDLINIWEKLKTILEDRKVIDSKSFFWVYENIIDNIYKIPSYYSITSNLFNFEIDYAANEDLIYFTNSLKKIFQNNKKDYNLKENIDFHIKAIYTLFTEDISSKLRGLKIRLKHRQNWLESYIDKRVTSENMSDENILFNNTYSKTNTEDNNELVFNNICQFVGKYLSNYYKIEDNKISLQDPQNYFINDFDIASDMIQDLDFKDTYSIKYKFWENQTGKLDFISSILFYKNNIINSTYEEILDNNYIDYIKVKENILQINYNSFNNSNKIYLLKDDLEKLLKSIHKELSIEKFWNLFYYIELSDEEIEALKNKDTVYYGIQDKTWKNLSNLNEIKEALKTTIFDEKLNNSSNSSEILEEIYNKVLWMIQNNIAVIWLSLSWRKNINKGTSTTTSIFNLYEKAFSINYAKFYKSTKDNISKKVYIFWKNTNISYIENEFNKCIEDTYDTIIEKIEERIKLYFEKDITSIVV